jgi:hypothetical protein
MATIDSARHGHGMVDSAPIQGDSQALMLCCMTCQRAMRCVEGLEGGAAWWCVVRNVPPNADVAGLLHASAEATPLACTQRANPRAPVQEWPSVCMVGRSIS